MVKMYREIPLGVKFIQKIVDKCFPRIYFNKQLCYRTSVLVLTYFAYMCYHLSRKPISVVKAVLHQNCSDFTPPANVKPDHITTWCDWAPFDGSDANASRLLGELDSAFLFAYAAAMFMSGFIAERVNLRYFLALGMLMSGLFSYLLGLAKTYNIHNLTYFVIVQAIAGVFQTTGWPGVVAVVGNWCGKDKRGLTFGIWNSHTSIGNILGKICCSIQGASFSMYLQGSLVAAEYVEKDWALSFIYPGLIIGVGGFVVFLFLVVNPGDVGCLASDGDNSNSHRKLDRSLQNQVANRDNISYTSSEPDDTDVVIGVQEVQRRVTEHTHLLQNHAVHRPERAIGLVGALKIPGVIEYSLSLFFSKLVSYTFLYWLPLYVHHSTTMSATYSADVSVLFDIGGIIGAIAAGAISDYSNMSATTCASMLTLAIPMMFVYQLYGAISLGVNIVLLIIVGLLVNGPYALITTAVSAELGTHSSLDGNSKALATVTAIIDGTGSIGAAVGPLLAGFVSSYGWNNVFYMLMVSDMLALILLLRLVKHELTRCRTRRSIRIE